MYILLQLPPSSHEHGWFGRPSRPRRRAADPSIGEQDVKLTEFLSNRRQGAVRFPTEDEVVAVSTM
jgi:hypothetical protein